MFGNIENINTSEDRSSKKSDALKHQIGAHVLATVGFEKRHKDIVDPSFNKARKSGEMLPGGGSERRNYAYISRLENLIKKHGNRLEKRLWKASVEKMIIQPENVTDSYFRTQEQILRDNGEERVLDDYAKSVLIENIQKQQRESLELWSNYLGDEQSPYPLWFKIYAWDGVTRMGVFDKEKGCFKKRDEHTVAPYPKLNPAVLAKVYGAVADYYGIKDEERYEENGNRNEILGSLVASGNFNKLYSKILLSTNAILKTPERTEDVHGEWVEYLPGDEEELASAAEGTPWCVADPGTGRNYLVYGNYDGHSDDYYHNKAKFILFHLYDSEKNMLSSSACASIRLGRSGRVAEISGLSQDQALEDSLVPIVEEKVLTLPGGEEYLKAFADKKELIRLDHKMQNNEELTREELEFLYETNRPIKTLDTYNGYDPRIYELKEKYGIGYALDKGVDVGELLSKLGPREIVENLDVLTLHGVDIDRLVSKISRDIISENLELIIYYGPNMKNLMAKLRPEDIAENLDLLYGHGVDVDINQLVPKLDQWYIAENLDVLIGHGAIIDIDRLVSELHPREIAETLDILINHGAVIDIDRLVSELHPREIAANLDILINHGAVIDIDRLVSELHPWEIVECLDALIYHGANIDIDQLVRHVDSYTIYTNLYTLFYCGADLNRLLPELDPDLLSPQEINLFLYNVTDINLIVSCFSSDLIVECLDTLFRRGADINQIVSRLEPWQIAGNLDILRAHGYQG